jgi:hypothetical protein
VYHQTVLDRDVVTVLYIVLAITVALVAYAVLRVVRRKNVDRIVWSSVRRRRESSDGPVHVFVTVTDHFEPYWHNRDRSRAMARVRTWREGYPRAVDGIRDAGGRPPRHAFFYPQEEYDADCLELLAGLRREGLGEVEVHLHHDRDTSAGLREKLLAFARTLHDVHGLLRTDGGDLPVYGFIHGNWTLDNSGPGGAHCGVNDELRVLAETGCYADFTYPSAPHPTQPPVLNTIYYATDDPARPRSHWKGTEAKYGRAGQGTLLLVSGPLAIDWRRRRRGLVPAIENGDITALNPAVPARVDAWIRAAIHVRGWPRWRFVKAYTHGAQEGNAAHLLSDRPGGLSALYKDLLARYNDGERYVLHFSSPWEIFLAVRALERADADAIHAIEHFQARFD